MTDSAHRMLAEFREGFRFNKMPVRLRLLRNAAYRRRIRLMILPPGMSKREKNQTRYDQRFVYLYILDFLVCCVFIDFGILDSKK